MENFILTIFNFFIGLFFIIGSFIQELLSNEKHIRLLTIIIFYLYHYGICSNIAWLKIKKSRARLILFIFSLIYFLHTSQLMFLFSTNLKQSLRYKILFHIIGASILFVPYLTSLIGSVILFGDSKNLRLIEERNSFLVYKNFNIRKFENFLFIGSWILFILNPYEHILLSYLGSLLYAIHCPYFFIQSLCLIFQDIFINDKK